MTFKQWLNENPMIALLFAVFIIVAVAGGVVTVVNPDAISFEEYTERLVIFAGAVGLLGGGRAIKNGLLGKQQTGGGLPVSQDEANERVPTDEELDALYPAETHPDQLALDESNANPASGTITARMVTSGPITTQRFDDEDPGPVRPMPMGFHDRPADVPKI